MTSPLSRALLVFMCFSLAVACGPGTSTTDADVDGASNTDARRDAIADTARTDSTPDTRPITDANDVAVDVNRTDTSTVDVVVATDATPDATMDDVVDVQVAEAGPDATVEDVVSSDVTAQDVAADTACTSSADCPAPANECQTPTCAADGLCAVAFVAAGTATATQVPGNCSVSQCDGAGNIVAVADDTDRPPSNNACEQVTCVSGTVTIMHVPSGTACAQNGGTQCDGSGNCVQCVAATDCPGTDTECAVRACRGGICGMSVTAAGTPTAAQIPGDCRSNQCDGAGNIVSANDNTDLPLPSGNQCQSSTCVNGTPSTSPPGAGTPCNQNGGTVCDGASVCVQCLGASDCPGIANECTRPTCVASVCGFQNAPVGTATATQFPGDCHANQCDGNGNIVSANDDTDLPFSPTQCRSGVCTNGVPSTPPRPLGTSCNDSGGVVCDGAGSCVQCTTATECPGADTECSARVCNSGSCGTNFAAAGTVTAAQNPGDCQVNECNGSGGIVSIGQDTDVPPSASQCLLGTCTNGVPSSATAPLGTVCAENGGVQCDGSGNCTQSFTVLRMGNGVAPLAATSTPGFLETYYPGASAVLVNTVALPTTATGSNRPLFLGGSATSEGGLSRSADGHYVVLAGYAGTAGTTTSGTTRVVGRVDANGLVDSSTQLPASAFVASSVRGATSVDGSNFWVSGTSTGTGGGVWYVPFGSTAVATQITANPNNMRMLNVFFGQLFGSSGSGAFANVFSFGGLPTTAGAIATTLPGEASTNTLGFALFDLNTTVAGPDTLFVADSALQKWTFNGTTWSQDTTFTPLTGTCLGVTGWPTSSGVTLIVSTATTIQRVVVPTSGSPVATLLTTAGMNTAYRGVTLAAH